MRTVSASVFLVAVATGAFGNTLTVGKRVLIEAEGRSDYTPKIVECPSPTGMCLRDIRSAPADKPVVQTEAGLRVVFETQGVIYSFQPDGFGTVTGQDGATLGTFQWSQ